MIRKAFKIIGVSVGALYEQITIDRQQIFARVLLDNHKLGFGYDRFNRPKVEIRFMDLLTVRLAAG